MTTYPGGKAGAGTYQKIINLMPPHNIYIEPFLGGGAVMRFKRPAKMNIGIDADADIIARWQASPVDLESSWQFIHDDGAGFLESCQYTGRDPVLLYCDPPYLMEARRQRRAIYKHEFSRADHIRLLRLLKRLPYMIILSGYHSSLYNEMLTDWNVRMFQSQTRGGKPATEYLWFNFPEPVELHDYRYLGANFRERDRIKRKTARWVKRLSSMPTLERQALLSAMRESAFLGPAE